jgi:signal transduction histidine kinase
MRPNRPKILARLSAWFTAEERYIFKVQLALIFAIITLLNVGFYRQRELWKIGVRQNLQSIVLGWDGLAWYVWAGAAPVMLILIRRYPLTRETLRRNLWRLTAGNLAIYLVVTNARYLFRILPNIWLPDSADLPIDWATYLHTILILLPIDFLAYSGFFATSFAIDYYFKHRQRVEEVQALQLESARLHSELVQAQLATLRGQLQPHFLFNSFNAIAMLVRQRQNDFAVETIAQLSGLLRMAIDNIDQPELSLEQELQFVACYLDVERVRFGDKLRTELETEPEALGCIVPGLVLQPLVENAIKHGISQRVAPGTVRVEVTRRGPRLDITVINDGPDSATVAKPGRSPGIGLSNTRSRLGHLYGDDFRLEMERISGGRMAVRLELPWRVSSVQVPAVQPEAVLT